MNGLPAEGPILVRVDADLEHLIPGFLDRRKEDVELLRAALFASDTESLEALGHALKGTGGGYGFDYLTEIGRDIEMGARSGHLAEVGAAVARLADYMDRVQVEFVT